MSQSLLSIWSQPPVVAALVTGSIAMILALWNFYSGRRAQRELEELKSELAQKKSENDARREYEFEARKRLYEEYEPLLFQLMEASENAYSRIRSLARSARNGSLDEGGWLSHFGYYSKSTIYNLFLPLAIYRIMKSKLTLVDLSVDKSIATQYGLIKQAYRTFMDDYKFANCEPILPYDGDSSQSAKFSSSDPSRYRKQGLPMGILDKMIEFLIEDVDGKERVISYGEFEKKISESSPGNDKDDLYYTRELFSSFHPNTRPVLWRILLGQALIYNVLLTLRAKDAGTPDSPGIVFSLENEELKRCEIEFNWKKDESSTFTAEYLGALSYLQRHYNTNGKYRK